MGLRDLDVRRYLLPLLAGGCLLPATAGATEPAWTEPVRISDVRPARDLSVYGTTVAWVIGSADPRVAFDGEGRAAAAWVQYGSPIPGLPFWQSERYTTAAAADDGENRWSAPQELPLTLPGLTGPRGFAVEARPGGDARLSWDVDPPPPTGSRAFIRADRSASRWLAPVMIHPPEWGSQQPKRLSALWHAPDGGAHGLTESDDTAAAGSWRPATGWSAPSLLPGWGLWQAAFDAAGVAHALVSPSGPAPAIGLRGPTSSATWTPETGWSEPHELGVFGGPPAIGASPGGEFVVIWEEWASPDGGPGASLHAAVRSADGTWGPSLRLAAPRTSFVIAPPAGGPKLAFAANGDAMLLWATHDGVVTATRPAGGTWTVGEPELPARPAPDDLLLNERGDAIAAWRSSPFPAACRTMVATRPAGGAWSTPRDLAECTLSGAAPIALNERGDAVVVFPGRDGVTRTVLAAGYSFPRGAWGCDVRLSSRGMHAIEPDVALDERGEAVAVWEQVVTAHPTAPAAEGAVFAARSTAEGRDRACTAETDPAAPRAPVGDPATPEPRPDGSVEQRVPEPARIAAAFAAVSDRARPARARALARRERTYRIRIRMSGTTSPGTTLEFSEARAAAGSLHAMATRLVIRAERSPRWVRLIDPGGRASAWRRVVLDRARPTIRAALLRRTAGGTRLRIAARDDASGVVRMQTARSRARPGAMAPFRAKGAAAAAGPVPRWVRVEDGMGRRSSWVRVRLR